MKHSRSRIIIDGAIAGLLGAGVVALWFLIFDAARGHIFETPVLLAAAILHGSHPEGISAIQLMLEYSVLHFGAFIIAGIIGANLLEAAENEPTLMVSLLVFLGAFDVFFIGVVMFLGAGGDARGHVVGNRRREPVGDGRDALLLFVASSGARAQPARTVDSDFPGGPYRRADRRGDRRGVVPRLRPRDGRGVQDAAAAGRGDLQQLDDGRARHRWRR